MLNGLPSTMEYSRWTKLTVGKSIIIHTVRGWYTHRLELVIMFSCVFVGGKLFFLEKKECWLAVI